MALKWYMQLKEAVRSRNRNVIVLHFNIRDLVFDDVFTDTPPSRLKNVSDFMLGELIVDRDWVLCYSASAGFTGYERRETTDGAVRPQQYFDILPALGVVGAGPGGTTIKAVMDDAAQKPYPLINTNGALDNPARPFTWRSPESTWPLLNRVLNQKWMVNGDVNNANIPVRLAVIIDYLDHLIPAQAHQPIQQQALEHMMSWSYSSTLNRANSLVIAFTSELEAVHRDLYGKDSRIEVIEVPWPQREERLAFIRYLKSHESEFPNLQLYTDTALEEFANLTSGLNYAEIRDFAKTLAAPVVEELQDEWKEPLRIRRQEMIVRQSGSLLVPRHSKFGLDKVAGYEYVKNLLTPRTDALRSGTADVSGILFTGPPGTGKSFFASCLARDVGIEMVTMQAIRGSYVGESERNFERVLRVATNMHPVIIFVDEIDQAFATTRVAGGDGGVEQRLFGRLLEFMEDSNNLGKVLWLAASNRPDNLDAALLSRFRLRIPFLLPDTNALKDMLRNQIPVQAGFSWNEPSWLENENSINQLITSKLLGKFSGREIDTLVRNAFVAARGAGQVNNNVVPADFLLPAIKSANISSNYRSYVLLSLNALRQVDASTSTLIESVREVMPNNIVKSIIIDDRLSMSGIAAVTANIDAYLW